MLRDLSFRYGPHSHPSMYADLLLLDLVEWRDGGILHKHQLGELDRDVNQYLIRYCCYPGADSSPPQVIPVAQEENSDYRYVLRGIIVSIAPALGIRTPCLLMHL